jgi:hypothetical protein
MPSHPKRRGAVVRAVHDSAAKRPVVILPVRRASSVGPRPRAAGRISLLWGGGATSTPRHGPELGAGSDGGHGPAGAQSRASAADQLPRYE